MTKIPPALAEKKAKLASSAYAAWTKARATNDFASFAPILAECFAVAAEVATITRVDEAELYDVALNEFEPGMTAKRCAPGCAEEQACVGRGGNPAHGRVVQRGLARRARAQGAAL